MTRSFSQSRERRLTFTRRLAAMSLIAALAFGADPPAAQAENSQPFKFMNIHFETNASGCDMGIQILFDTDGVTQLSVEDPNDNVVFSSETPVGMEETQDQTEGFQERVEPPIAELEAALGCDPDPDAIALADMLEAWPAGLYEFEATSDGTVFEGARRLTHRIPAGPAITAPADGAVVPHTQPLHIRWSKVAGPIMPSLGPVEIVGYHVVVKDITSPGAGPLLAAAFDVDVSRNETSVAVPSQYLEPNRIYEFEVLATEKSGNQTISEGGVFCTPSISPANCEAP
jgi:hypothetical protein